jgi:Fe-S cluster assembly scaffold protein SufB
MKAIRFSDIEPPSLIVDGSSVTDNRDCLDKNGICRFQGSTAEAVNVIVIDQSGFDPLNFVFEKKSQTIIRLIFEGEPKEDIKIDFDLEEEAKVIMTQIFAFTVTSPLKISLKATVNKGASLRIDDSLVHFGDLELDDCYSLCGENASLYHRTLHIASGAENVKRVQTVMHQAKSTISELENYLIAVDTAKLKYHVSGIIEKGNNASSCKQTNRGLIFGEHAEIEADPNLLINEFDVFAAHGAAIGQINEDELFYLKSRGINELEAKKLILAGYVNPFLKALNHPEYAEHINHLIEAKIKGAGLL